jgi:uncharacterized protein (DUF1501 family)
MNRRLFLKNGGIAVASVSAAVNAPAFLLRAAAQTPNKGRRKLFVAIFQRGAMDGLNAVIPYGEAEYYNARPNIAVPKPGDGQLAALDLNGHFGLHPSLAPFKPLWDSGQLAIVHAVGSHDNTRSHFDAQDYMEIGTPGVKSTPDGWLNRYLQSKAEPQATPFRSVSMTANLPRTMQGKAPSLAISNLNDFGIRGAGQQTQAVQGGFEAMYSQAASQALRGTGHETFEAVKLLKQANPQQYKPEAGVMYPRGQYGDRLRQLAQLIKSDIGVEVAFSDIGGWDTHINEGAGQGQLAGRLTEFGQGIAALYADLKAYADDVVILTMTEFGRTVRENGNRGTDHGHGSAMFVLGGAVKGKQLYGKWPGLKTANLHEGRDLAVTTDFRDVCAEIAKVHLRAANLNAIFPGYQVNAANFKGLLHA